MESECLTCKKHYSQGGDCWEHKRNCLYYDKEPRGKMMMTTFSFEMRSDAENTLVKQGEKLIIDDPGKEIEITIIKINYSFSMCLDQPSIFGGWYFFTHF